jgi:hypothetical protein
MQEVDEDSSASYLRIADLKLDLQIGPNTDLFEMDHSRLINNQYFLL